MNINRRQKKRQTEAKQSGLPMRILRFYTDGFRQMTVGRQLWIMIAIKIIILFAVFKLFFFPDILKSRYDNDAQRAQAVRSALLDKRTAL